MKQFETYSKLTNREKEYLMHISEGLSYQEINKAMDISTFSGNKYRYNIKNKTGLNTNVRLARFYDTYIRKVNDKTPV